MESASRPMGWISQTSRAVVFLLLGGVILLPYVLLVVGFTQMFRDGSVSVVVVTLLAAVTAVIAVLPPFLTTVRGLEVTAARTLLGVDLPDPGPTPEPATRWRGAAFYVVHLLLGGIAMLALLAGVPVALGIALQAVGPADEVLGGLGTWPGDTPTGLAGVGLAVLVVAGLVLVLNLLGRGVTRAAAALLGPSLAERMAAMEDRARWLADRNRLARELHDSVGHALTVTTLQAAAARGRIATDPDFAVRALAAIEETGRSALADLDHALGLLRESTSGPITSAPTLAELPRLWAEARASGAELSTDVRVEHTDLPAVVSTESYRIVQEALTNALRHGAPGPVSVRVAVEGGILVVRVRNPLDPGHAGEPARVGGGHGLRGAAERVVALGGSIQAGPTDDDAWLVQARLPRGRR